MKTTADVTHREKDERASHPCTLDAIPERVRQIAMLRGLGYSYRQIAARSR
jgi:DNA-directed RNA polymerase specialized sigma24 family protein